MVGWRTIQLLHTIYPCFPVDKEYWENYRFTSSKYDYRPRDQSNTKSQERKLFFRNKVPGEITKGP